ncbi:hypothetical protein SCB49_09110 [unidentified eubacterium SCB49]|nr:hypothetical protein SCB49_09110 [unidentified eubacterium SCB49]
MDRKKIDYKKLPINGSLALLAYGDLAFTAWRKLKVETRKKENEEK